MSSDVVERAKAMREELLAERERLLAEIAALDAILGAVAPTGPRRAAPKLRPSGRIKPGAKINEGTRSWQIVAALRTGPRERRALRDAVDMPQNTFSAMLFQLVRSGHVVRDGEMLSVPS